jgi:hypothetical protein
LNINVLWTPRGAISCQHSAISGPRPAVEVDDSLLLTADG